MEMRRHPTDFLECPDHKNLGGTAAVEKTLPRVRRKIEETIPLVQPKEIGYQVQTAAAPHPIATDLLPALQHPQAQEPKVVPEIPTIQLTVDIAPVDLTKPVDPQVVIADTKDDVRQAMEAPNDPSVTDVVPHPQAIAQAPEATHILLGKIGERIEQLEQILAKTPDHDWKSKNNKKRTAVGAIAADLGIFRDLPASDYERGNSVCNELHARGMQLLARKLQDLLRQR